MNCPHCNENIAVRLEKPGRKAARRRFLRARRAQRLSELALKSPLNQPRKSNRPNGPQMPRRTRKMPYGEGCPRQWRRKLRRQGREAMDEMMEYTKSSKKIPGLMAPQMSEDVISDVSSAVNDGVTVLSNGVKVVNSSPHPFVFDDGTVVPPCGVTLNARSSSVKQGLCHHLSHR